MKKQATSDLRKQLNQKWPKISKEEVEDILSHHDHLRKSLSKHYKMNEKDAKREEENFFNPPKATGTCG